MSKIVEVDYEHIAMQSCCICEVAEGQIAEIERMLADLSDGARSLLNDETAALRQQIEQERGALLARIGAVREGAEVEARKGRVSMDDDSAEYKNRNSAVEAARALQEEVNRLSSTRLPEMRALLDTLLGDRIAQIGARMADRERGATKLDEAARALLDTISDATLRQFTYLTYLQDPSLSGEALLAAGRALMGETVESRKEREAELIRAELAAARVPQERVAGIVRDDRPLTEIREAATAEIVGEKVRQRSVMIITKAIAARGFIVDKKNIRINRETNEVTIVALKASGERATFRVLLDGKFIYDFKGYEGQACQQDISPFMTALEEVYGLHVTGTQEIFSNPDKISTMKYQAMNTKTGKR